MPGGRPAKPTALKLLHGTARPDRVNAHEPRPPAGAPKPPKWLSSDARKIWRGFVPLLEEMRVLTVADATALALLADAVTEYAAARAVVEDKGQTYETSRVVGTRRNEQGEEEPILSTMVRARPEVAIASDAWRRITQMLQQFGLTPSARSKVAAAGEPEASDPMEALLNERRSG